MVGAVLFTALKFTETRVSRQAAHLPLQLSEIEQALGYGGLIHNFKNYVLRPDEEHLAAMVRADITRALTLIDEVLGDLDGGGVDATLHRTREAVHSYVERIDRVEALHAQGATAREIDAIVRYNDAPALRELSVFRAQLAADVMNRLEFLRWSGMAVFMATLAAIFTVQVIALKENRKSRMAYVLAREALERERQVNGELREFAYAMSHDLKSPMNTVRMLLAEIREGQDRDRLSLDQCELIDKSLATVDRVNVQIVELLRYAATIETGEERDEAVNLDAEVRGVLDDLSGDIAAVTATFEMGPLPHVMGNRAQLRVLFQNLIGNALKYRRPEVPLRVRIAAMQDQHTGDVRIDVEDNGLGIAVAHHEKVFGMFKRLHRESQIPGTGLGLSVSRRVARNLGGSLDIESVPDAGSTFSLTIPSDRIVKERRRAA